MPEVIKSALVVVDGTEYPIDFTPGAINAEQVVMLRTLGVTPETLGVVLVTEDRGTTELPELVGLMGLSLTQQDRPCDLGWLARKLTGDSEVKIQTELVDEPEG